MRRHVGITSGRLSPVLAAGAIVVAASGQSIFDAPQADADKPPQSVAEVAHLAVQTDTEVVHPGTTFHVVVRMNLEPDWHVYWMNAGDVGMATDIQIKAPEGFSVAAARFPRPMRIEESEGVAFGYQDTAVFFVPVTAPTELAEGEVSLSVDARFLVCKKICLFGSEQRTVTVATRSEAVSPPPRPDAELEPFRRRLPRPLQEQPGATIEFATDTLRVTGGAEGHTEVSFFPAAVPGVSYGSAVVTVEDDRFEMSVPVVLKPGNAQGEPMRLAGLIALGSQVDDPSYDFSQEVEPAR